MAVYKNISVFFFPDPQHISGPFVDCPTSAQDAIDNGPSYAFIVRQNDPVAACAELAAELP